MMENEFEITENLDQCPSCHEWTLEKDERFKFEKCHNCGYYIETDSRKFHGDFY